MPIPMLKTKTQRKQSSDEAEPPPQKSTMLPRATRLPAGAGASSTPHMTCQIPSPYQGHREGRTTRLTASASKLGSRMQSSSGPRPPPRTSSVVKVYAGPKAAAEKNIASSSSRTPAYSKQAGTGHHSLNPLLGRQPNYIAASQQQQSHLAATVCAASNRNSVISNCSSNPAPSTSSSNRNSSSSIGSSFSVGSWNGTSEVGDAVLELGERRPNSGTFPRIKSISINENSKEVVPRAMIDRSKLRMPITYAPRIANAQTSTRLAGKPLSTSDSSIVGARARVACSSKPNSSVPNLVESSSLKRFNARLRSQPAAEKLLFAVPNSVLDYDSSDYEDSKKRGGKPAKLTRDVKYRKDNVAMVIPFKPVPQDDRPVTGSEIESPSGTVIAPASPEEDDGYGSVALTDQTEEDERCGTRSSSYIDSTQTVIEPMAPMKLMDSYSYFKCSGSACTQPILDRNDISSSVNISASQIASEYRDEVAAKRPQETNVYMSDYETSSKRASPYEHGGVPAQEMSSYCSATVPKNVKFSSKIDAYSVSQPTAAKIDDSVYGVSYGKLVNYKTELIKKQTESRGRHLRKLAVADVNPKKNADTAKVLPPQHYLAQSSSILGRSMPSQAIPVTGYSPRPNAAPLHVEMSNSSDADKQIFNRTKSLRYPGQKDTKRELFPVTKSGDSNNTSPIKNVSFPRGANKYSTVIPRTSDGLKTRQNRQLTSFGATKEKQPPTVASQRYSEPTGVIETEAACEIMNLKAQVKVAKEHSTSLTEQLNSKSKLLSAYEHSLTNITHRLQHLSSLVEQKDIQISELKKMVEKMCLDGVCISSSYGGRKGSVPLNRGPSMESLASVASMGSVVSYYSTTSSLFSVDGENKLKKKKNWIRSSFNKAFKRKEKKRELEYDSSSDVEFSMKPRTYTRSISEPFKGYCSLPASPVPHRNFHTSVQQQPQHKDQSDSEMSDSANIGDEMKMLRHSLRDKEKALTESRLEALSSAHQIDGLKENMQKLSFEVATLKSSKAFKPGNTSLSIDVDRLPSMKYREIATKKITVLISKSLPSDDAAKSSAYIDVNIGQIIVSNTTTWKELFGLVETTFTGHVSGLDTEKCLGVDTSSIASIRIGDLVSASSDQIQQFLPYGYFVGDVDWVRINLAGQADNTMDQLVYETLVPKQTWLRYVSVLQESRRLILGGVDGTGKRYLAQKLAEVVIKRLGIKPSSINIAKFQAHNHTTQDLTSYLCHINELCEARRSDLPLVIILESLSSTEGFLELLASSLKIPNDQCPYIICTVRVSDPKNYELASSLSNFRWISLGSCQESSERLLRRICRRARLHEKDAGLLTILDWIPRCFNAINTVLAKSFHQLIEPGAFLPLPKCLDRAQIWFSTIWKATVLPKILQVAENGQTCHENLDTWKQLYSCLKEELPWNVFPSNYTANFPLVLQTIEASC